MKSNQNMCFSYIPNGVGGYKIIKIKKGEKGYIEMHYRHYDDEAEISREVSSMNKEFYDLTDKEAAVMSLSSL
jgi:hypothetical protein